MKKSFIRALKDLHRLESGPAMDGMSAPAEDVCDQHDVERHGRRLDRHELDDARFFSVSAEQLSSCPTGSKRRRSHLHR